MLDAGCSAERMWDRGRLVVRRRASNEGLRVLGSVGESGSVSFARLGSWLLGSVRSPSGEGNDFASAPCVIDVL